MCLFRYKGKNGLGCARCLCDERRRSLCPQSGLHSLCSALGLGSVIVANLR